MGLLSKVGKGIKAFHGSPHDFERFEYGPRTALTGEGAAAFGPGLYFAEKEAVAKQYRDALSVPWDDPNFNHGAKDVAKQWVSDAGGDVDGAARKFLEFAKAAELREAEIAEILHHMKPLGKMYEVNLSAGAGDLVDWDTPIREQGDAVGAAADELFEGDWRSWNPRGAELVSGVWNDARKTQDSETILASLKDKGLKGTRYLDQGSRGSGNWRTLSPHDSVHKKWVAGYAPNGPNRYFDTEKEMAKYIAEEEAKRTRNFAIWDDSIIDILRKYGLPVAATGGLLSRVGQSEPA